MNFKELESYPMLSYLSAEKYISVTRIYVEDESSSAVLDEMVRGHGIVIYAFQYKDGENLIEISTSGNPANFIRKDSAGRTNSSLKQIFVIQGTEEYSFHRQRRPLASLLHNRILSTNCIIESTYANLNSYEDIEYIWQDRISNLVDEIISYFSSVGFDMSLRTVTFDTSKTPKEGRTIVEINGLDVNIRTKLIDRKNPALGYETIHVKVKQGRRLVISAFTNLKG